MCVLSQFFGILLGKEEAHGAHGHHDIIGRDPEEHQDAHRLAPGEERTEYQQECRLNGAHAGHIGQSVGEESISAVSSCTCPKLRALESPINRRQKEGMVYIKKSLHLMGCNDIF